MSGAVLDRLLAALLVLELATGLLTLRAGIPATAPLFWLHGVVGGALLVASAEKLRRSVGPAVRHGRWRRLALGAVLTLLVAAALAGGFGWVASGRILSIGPWTILTLHTWAALAIIPIVLVHLVPRRWRLLRPPRAVRGPRISRRTVLRLAGLGALGAAAWMLANVSDVLRGGERRFTGSRWLPDGGVPPPTTFFGEGAPAIDHGAWRLRIDGDVPEPGSIDLAGLVALGEVDVDAVLDCTSGWAMRTDWRGVPLGAVLRHAGVDPSAASVTIRSATGWSTRLPPDEIGEAVLATAVAGQPLRTANGAPVRLVAPRRRGLDWVKWVDEIHVG